MASQITPLPSPVPQRSAPSTFSARMDAFLAALAAFVTQTNTLASEAETDAATADAQAARATAQAVLATDAKAVAMAAANYKGPWSSQTGAAAVPYCVSHADSYWMLTSNLSNVAAKEPGVAAEWIAVADGTLIHEISEFPDDHTQVGLNLLNAASAAAQRTALGLAIGTDVMAYEDWTILEQAETSD